jgi:hypothetical protein
MLTNATYIKHFLKTDSMKYDRVCISIWCQLLAIVTESRNINYGNQFYLKAWDLLFLKNGFKKYAEKKL